jgi:sigma-B regulation protein RsbU (phosphoserine phosphatase)
MKFLRDSIGKKYILFLAFLSIVSLIGYLTLQHFNITEVSLLYIFWGLLALLFLVSLFFYEVFFIPVMKIAHEVKLMLTGKEFKKIKPSTIDEVGIFTYFFNKISHNLEKIADDIENNKRLVSELDIAGEIQRDILPKESPSVEGLDIVANTISADEMGGDSFDVLQHNKDTYIYIGDVTGHGVPASLVMMMVNTLMTAFAENGYSMKEIITKTNSILREKVSSQRFMTLVMLRWNELTEEMSWVGAGHEYILIYRAKTKEVEAVKSGGIALKMSANIDHIIVEKQMEKLADDDVVLLYTDGITEGKNPDGEMYEVERLIESLKKHGKKSTASAIFDSISEDFANFVLDTKQEDDVTLIVVKRLRKGLEKRVPMKLMINSVLNKKEQEKNAENKWKWDNEKMK